MHDGFAVDAGFLLVREVIDDGESNGEEAGGSENDAFDIDGGLRAMLLLVVHRCCCFCRVKCDNDLRGPPKPVPLLVLAMQADDEEAGLELDSRHDSEACRRYIGLNRRFAVSRVPNCEDGELRGMEDAMHGQRSRFYLEQASMCLGEA